MIRCIVYGIILVITCSVISVFLAFSYVERSIINESKELAEEVGDLKSRLQNSNNHVRSIVNETKELAAEVKDLEVRLMDSNNNERQLKVEIDKLSKRNDELENIEKERFLNIMSMYQVGT
jgi:septal ring factor EnvC (AmiA/AmiB activator)